MPTIVPGADFTSPNAAMAASRGASARSGSDRASADTSSGTANQSAFDTMVGLATPTTPPAANTGPASKPGMKTEAGTPGDLQQETAPAGTPAGETAGNAKPATGASPGADTAPGSPTAPAGTASTDGGSDSPGDTAPDGARLASAGGWTGQGQPEYAGDITAHSDAAAPASTAAPTDMAAPRTARTDAVAGTPANTTQAGAPTTGPDGGADRGQPEIIAKAGPRQDSAASAAPVAGPMRANQSVHSEPQPAGLPGGANPPGQTMAGRTVAAAVANPATASSPIPVGDASAAAQTSTPVPNGGTARDLNANPAAEPAVAPGAAGQAEKGSVSTKGLDGITGAKLTLDQSPTPPDGDATKAGPASSVAGTISTQGSATIPAMNKAEKPPVMAVLSQSSPAPTQREPALPASPAVTATPAATPGSQAPTQSLATGTVSPGIAEAAPAGRFAQARQGVDERDGNIAAGRNKGRPIANAAGQAGAKAQNASASAPPQAAPATPSASPAETPSTSRELPVSTPQPPAAAAAPLTTEAARVSSVSLDPALSTTTSTGAAATQSASRGATEAGQTARFTPHAAQHLAGQISQRFANGSRVFGIRLDPAELGRVDIRLELSQNNRVQATLTVERGDTLAEMQRSARELERALNDAGLELEEDGLTFELNEGNGEQQSAEAEQGNHFNVYGQDEDGAQEVGAEIETGPADAYGFRLSRRDGVDLRV